MLKSLTMISVSAAALLASTQAYSHVLCAPNTPHINIQHSHHQVHTVPRIQPVARHTITHTVARPVQQVRQVQRVQVNQNQQKHLQAQRARQQQALANQRRITQQRRAQAQRAQQQIAARKAQQIKQQQAAAHQARAARQQAALHAARSRPVVQQPQRVAQFRPAPQPRVVQRQPVQQQVTTHSHNPAPVYVAPTVQYVPAPVYYVPARTSVSIGLNYGYNSRRNFGHNRSRRHIRHGNRSRHSLRYPGRPLHRSHRNKNW